MKKTIPQTSVIGASGEYLVLSTLLKHNFIAGKAPENTKDYDLVVVNKNGVEYIPPHLSKDQDIKIQSGDTVRVSTPGGGGFGNPFDRDPQLVERDVKRGYYDQDQARQLFGVVIGSNGLVDLKATTQLRSLSVK